MINNARTRSVFNSARKVIMAESVGPISKFDAEMAVETIVAIKRFHNNMESAIAALKPYGVGDATVAKIWSDVFNFN